MEKEKLAPSVARRLQLESLGEEHHGLCPSHSQSLQEVFETFTKLSGTQENTPKIPKPSTHQQEQNKK